MKGGLQRYNEVQKILSAQIKHREINLKSEGKSFREIAKTVYYQTKSQASLNRADTDSIISNIITSTPDNVPEIISDLLVPSPYFTFNERLQEYKSEVGNEFIDNLYIDSFTCSEQGVPAASFTYEPYMQPFFKFCNDNKDRPDFAVNNDYGPELMLTPPELINGKYVSRLISDDEPNNYGFTPDKEGVFIPQEPIPEEEEIEVTPEPPTDKSKEKKLAKAKAKADKQALKIKTLENQSKKLDVQKRKETNKTLDKLEKLYDRGIITKAQYGKKVMEIEM